ncbi:MAG: hypothetical protein ACLFTA_00240 [Candidatus Nanohaloarchaea archaeon]
MSIRDILSEKPGSYFKSRPEVDTTDKPYDAEELADLAEEILGKDEMPTIDHLGMPGMGFPGLQGSFTVYSVREDGVDVNSIQKEAYDALEKAEEFLEDVYGPRKLEEETR